MPALNTRTDDENSADFVWRFRLDEVQRAQPVYDDELLELLRAQWEELLKLTRPTLGGQEVQIDGFSTYREPDAIHRIFEDDSAG